MQRQRSFFGFYIFGAVLVAVCAGAVFYFWQTKQSDLAAQLKERAAVAEAGPSVAVATSKKGSGVRKLTLLGEALPYKSATLYSKVSGYLSKIAVDKGDHVKAGQFIAEINSPELDHQYSSALADLENKQRLAKRQRELADQKFISVQAAEDAETNVKLSEQQVAGVKALTSYKVLTAPFAGVVTARYVDLGALVTNATSNQSSSLPVVTISDPSHLRVTVYVDQSEAPNVRTGIPAEVVDASNSSRQGMGKVARVSGELDTRTRTQLTEVDFDNGKGEFIPGSFVNVSLLIPAKSYIEVPAPALIMRDGKRMVAVVGPDSRIKLTPITVAGTDGKVIRIESGLDENVTVALNLPNTVADSAKVKVAGSPTMPAAAQTPPTPITSPGAKSATAAGK